MKRVLTAALLAAGLQVAGCALWPGAGAPPDQISLRAASFADLPGWPADRQGQAVLALQRSCARVRNLNPEASFGAGGFAGTAAPWQRVCRDLDAVIPLTDDAARAFFEDHFTPYEVWGNDSRDGLFTGYYQPLLHGSRHRHGRFQIPIYGRPRDLVQVNLGDFRPSLKGESLMGRVDGEKLVPYYRRDEIEAGQLRGRRAEIVWVDNAVDAFFLHIQGSGLIRMDNGRMLSVGYAAQNGHPYLAIGKALLERGELEKGNVSMQSIRAWLESHPDEAPGVMNLNASYVFFRPLRGQENPLGAEGVELTPGRSLAVDRKKLPYGLPLWLDAEDPDDPEGDERLQRLMVAQDTGGAITGAVRGDFFWGAGETATRKAGLMKSRGRFWALLPQDVAVPADKTRRIWWRELLGLPAS